MKSKPSITINLVPIIRIIVRMIRRITKPKQ